MMQETRLHPKDFIYPIFVMEGEDIRNPVESMPGIFQYSIDRLHEILDQVKEAGIGGVMLFGIPVQKDPQGSQAYAVDGITQRAVRYIRERYPEIYIVVDICLCEYTSHGHCGMVQGEQILNDETLPYLVKMAVSLAQAGQEALREIAADIEEGADIVMVKPALAYLDVLKEAALSFDVPLAVYNVSGEYAMVKAAAANGWIDEKRIVTENLTAMKRAGAKIIITYHALDAVKWLG